MSSFITEFVSQSRMRDYANRITDPTEIDSILNSGSYREFKRLVPTLQEGMRRLWSHWERSAKEETVYGIPLTAQLELPTKSDWTPYFRIYTQKEVIVRGVKYYVIASHCYNEFDNRNNYQDYGEVHVSLLAYKKGEEGGPIYLLSGTYWYIDGYDGVFDVYSIPGYSKGPRSIVFTSYTEDGEPIERVEPLEEEILPGLTFRSAVRLADFMPQLSSNTKHKGYGNYADTREVFNIRDFKEDLAFIAAYATELTLSFRTHSYGWEVDHGDIQGPILAKMGMASVADVQTAIRERVLELSAENGAVATVNQKGNDCWPELNITFAPTTPFTFLQALMTDSQLLRLIRDSSPLFSYHDFQTRNPVNGKRWSLSYGVRVYKYFGKKNEGADVTKRNAKASFNFPA